MTDAGGIPPRLDRVEAAERERLLRQIASALDLPVSAFSHRQAADDMERPSSAECSAVLAAFCAIRDPQVRTFCLTVLETFSRK